ncbi:MAG: class I SAM-dependent methyltransferase, partial [Desulfobacula sp.]|nr:class I SAM-dependent methyltransferase [Desulfobacula sp.]
MNPYETGEGYNKIAEWWVNAQMENPEYGMKYIQKAIKYAKDKSRVLDLGCGGTGRTIDEFLKHDFTVIGIDVSSEMINLAKLKHPNVHFVHTDFISWKAEETFDLIIAWDSIFHAPIELQEKATLKMCRQLNPGGILLFTAGSYVDKASGEMEGVLFEYGTIGYHKYLDVMEKMNCKIILMEEDQYPAGHMV